MEVKKFEMDLAGRKLIIETGRFAHQANGSCTVQYGDTVVLATATMGMKPRDGISFFPLMVDYEEKLYAVGKIKGSRFIKREGRPTDEAVLTGRMIDRGLRPLFDSSIRNDIQVIVSVLSYDGQNDPDIPGIIAASTALHMSDIPWNGPLAAMRVGYINNEYILNPLKETQVDSTLDLVLSTTSDKVVMVESGAQEVPSDIYAGAFEFGLKHASDIVNLIEEVRKSVGKKKFVIEDSVEKLVDQDGVEIELEKAKKALKEFLADKWDKYLFNVPRGSKGERKEIMSELKDQAKEFLATDYNEKVIKVLLSGFSAFVEEQVTRAVLDRDQRIDGRAITDIRELVSEVGLLPRTHGSAMFMRGETQVLSIVTLGAPGDEQTLDGMEENGKKHYMHHYNFPPFSVGEVKPLRGASRRDIGHGSLAEKALMPVLPSKESFPYTIRVVSEVLGSNGSSSMASTCGSTLSLMDAGVPIKRPVAGIAIGVASDDNGNYKVITDIQDLEDGKGGMDFKVCGTREGITAIQMDTKTDGLSMDMIREALSQGDNALERILKVMEAAIKEPREELSQYAPRIISFKIHPDKIREVIGPGGKIINEIIDATGVIIDIEDSGSVHITAVDPVMGKKAQDWIFSIVKEAEVGEIYDGKVVKIADFGAFVEILPGKDGLVHISELSTERVAKVEDVLKLGQIIKVKVIKIDDVGRVNLSIKQLDEKKKPLEQK